MKKTPQPLIDEALKLYDKFPASKVSKIIGVPASTIKDFVRKHRINNELRPPKINSGPVPKYTREQKMACIKLAIRYFDTGHCQSVFRAFVAAGKIVNINGAYIYYHWTGGAVPSLGYLVSAQQKGGVCSPDMLSGDSMNEARPQSQRCLEHERAVVAMRPAPRMIKRRLKTSDNIPDGVFKGHRSQA